MRFRTALLTTGKTAAGFVVPEEVMAGLGAGKKPAVTVTINGHSYRSTVATIDGRPMVGVSAENRAAAGVAGGDDLDVDLVLDTAPRTVELPADFAAALATEPRAQAFFDGLNYSERRWFVLGVEDAKTAETRQRRIEKFIARLLEGRGVR
ncbi:MAG TPA: YdeI/OmpD-associated family protein [Candidatus Limnocylindrales bacterium]|nr:YdeI/OmpD-associated family protein [Candidatus Limnocylindrales bacterium]